MNKRQPIFMRENVFMEERFFKIPSQLEPLITITEKLPESSPPILLDSEKLLMYRLLNTHIQSFLDGLASFYSVPSGKGISASIKRFREVNSFLGQLHEAFQLYSKLVPVGSKIISITLPDVEQSDSVMTTQEELSPESVHAYLDQLAILSTLPAPSVLPETEREFLLRKEEQKYVD